MRLLLVALAFCPDVSSPPARFDPFKVSLVRMLEADAGRACVAAISPDGRLFAAAGKAEIQLRALATGESIRSLDPGGAVDQLRFSGDGRHLILLNTVDGLVRILQLPEGTESGVIKDINPLIHTVAASPDGRFLAVSSKSGCRIHEVSGGREVRTIAGASPAWSRDGKRIGTLDEEGVAKVWNPETGAVLVSSSGKSAGGCSMAFSPDGKRFATANNWGEIRIWGMSDGKEQRVLVHPGFTVLLDWSRDGRWIASGANDGIVRLWDASDGREVRKLEAHNGMINTLAFVPDGRSLLTAGADGKVKLWSVARRAPEGGAAGAVGAPGTGMVGLTGADAGGGGATITSIIPGSAAERYGLQVGDVITEFKGTTITGYAQLASEVLKYGEGEEVKIKIKRADAEVELKLKLGHR